MKSLVTHDAPSQLGRALARPGIFRFSVRRFLAALVLLLFAAPFVEDMKHGQGFEALLVTLVLCMGVLAVGGRRRTLILAILLAVPAAASNLTLHFLPLIWLQYVAFGARLLFLAFIMANLLAFILRAPRVNSEVLCAGISVYLLLGVIWTTAYVLVGSLDSKSFAFSVPPSSNAGMAGFNAIYFSYTTLTTLGYGDITPVSNVARMLAIAESMCGTLFVGVLIARLVSLYSTPSPVETTDDRLNGPPTPSETAHDPRMQSETPHDSQRL